MSEAEEKSGRRREREREMDARTRPLGSRASTSPFPAFFPVTLFSAILARLTLQPRVVVSFLPPSSLFFLPMPPRFLARDAAIRQLFSDHLPPRIYSNRKMAPPQAHF